MSAEARVMVRVRGVVQGVGFRDWVRRVAAPLGLAGWVRNLTDGRVEIVAEGDRSACESLLDTLYDSKATPGRVHDVDVSWAEPTGEPVGFRIR